MSPPIILIEGPTRQQSALAIEGPENHGIPYSGMLVEKGAPELTISSWEPDNLRVEVL